MQSSVEQLEGLAHKLTIEIPAKQIDDKVEQRLKEIRPRIRLDGFRPGKVPPNVIKQKYGNDIRREILSDTIETAYRNALEEHQQTPVAPPKLEVESGFQSNEPLKFTAIFEIAPEVEVKGLEELNITLPQSELGEQDIDFMIETLRRQQATFSETEEAAAKDDRVTVDFVGKLDGEVFEGGSGEDVKVSLGSGQMLADFEEGLLGTKQGDDKTFDVTFPEDYPAEHLAGKTAQFNVQVKQVEKINLPEVDEEFIKRFGLNSADESSFRKAIEENMTRELENALRRIKRERLFDALLEKNSEQQIAEGAVEQEIERMSREMKLDQQIADAEQRQKIAQQIFDETARRRVRLGVLLGKLFEERNIEIDQERVQQRLDSIAATYEDPEEVRQWYQQDQNAQMNLQSSILEEQLIDQLYEKANISHEDKTFQEVMTLNSQLRN